jgi:hypothetical protein
VQNLAPFLKSKEIIDGYKFLNLNIKIKHKYFEGAGELK